MGVDIAPADGIIDYYNADVVSAQDNYVFGMTMPGRNFQSDKYRFGFNGKEKDKDITSGDLDFDARIYDSRLGRWLSTDVLESKYPFASTYCFGLNNPISFADADGRLIWIPDASYADKITALLQKSFAGKIKAQLVKSDENQRTYLKFELNKDVKLSETETKAFEYLKALADNQTFTLEVKIYDKEKRIDRYNDYDVDPDNFQSKVLYPNRLADYQPGLGINEAGQYLVHFFAEQFAGTTIQDEYNSAHAFAIGKGGEIFNVKWTESISIIKDNKLNVDIDITDKDGIYIQTVRETVDRTTKKSTFTNFIRTDVKPGEKSFGAVMSMNDWSMKTKGKKYDASYSTEYEAYAGKARAAYYKNNPVPDAKKATTNNSSKKTKKG